MKKESKMWGGRFAGAMDELLEALSQSIDFDYKLYSYDITGSIAHARMLGRQGLVSKEEAQAMVRGLEDIRADIDAGRFKWDPGLEDVHMNIERALADRIGPVGEKLHTARSRNDQIALDTRLYMKDAINLVAEGIRGLRLALVRQAESNTDLYMPGYTHTQRAQPVSAAHHLMAYQEMLARDDGRLRDLFKRVDVMPLGAAALAGTGLPIDMKFVAEQLGFSKVTRNSIDAVADRDHIVEFLAAASMLMMHLSRLSEDLILWATAEYDFVDLPDELCTGSSIMPQKKNPDGLELIRGKTGRVYGHLISLLTVLKGLPMSYNRDLQEDKEPLFDTVETLARVLPLMARLVGRMRFKADNLIAAAADPMLLATDLADHLVLQGVPFRSAHALVGRAVRFALDAGVTLTDLSEEKLIELCPGAASGVKKELTAAASLKSRATPGGTAPKRVRAEVRRALRELQPPVRAKGKK